MTRTRHLGYFLEIRISRHHVNMTIVLYACVCVVVMRGRVRVNLYRRCDELSW